MARKIESGSNTLRGNFTHNLTSDIEELSYSQAQKLYNKVKKALTEKKTFVALELDNGLSEVWVLDKLVSFYLFDE